MIDNFTWMRGTHALKAGIDAQFIADERVRGEQFLYTFPTIAAYLAAKSGANPFGYTNLQQDLRQPRRVSYNSALLRLLRPGRLAAHAADEAALRPALRPVRRAVGAAVRRQPVSRRTSRSTRTTSARAPACRGRSTAGARPSLRASTGLMYEPPLLDFYDNAILNNGDPTSYTVSVAGTDAPARRRFPAAWPRRRPGSCCRGRASTRSIPDFRTQSAWLSNVQVERALQRPTWRSRSAT